jgi:SAM-dependent methyltransferase
MKRIRRKKMRYGEPGFDQGYLQWGVHDAGTQAQEAESILRLTPSRENLRILDLACGPGRHAAYWAKQGHQVTAIDISETFIAEARKQHGGIAGLCFRVGDIKELGGSAQYDVVTWIERSFFDEDMARGILRVLRPGGVFITDMRNPEHAKVQRRTADWRSWQERDGVFFLERHETNPATGKREDVWITLDPGKQEIVEEYEQSDHSKTSPAWMAETLTHAGFQRAELRTMDGEVFTTGKETYWLWLVARK